MTVPPLPTARDTIESLAVEYLASPALRRVTLSGTRTTGPSDTRKVVLRPVEVRGRRVLQVVQFDERRSTTTNVDDPTGPEVTAILRLPFRHVTVALTDEIIEGRVTKKGRLVTSRTATDHKRVDTTHDRPKKHAVGEDTAFLEVTGLAVNGRVKPSGRAKYRQINDFIRLLDSALPGDTSGAEATRQRLDVVDLGCGNGYLTFAVYHYLTETLGIECRLVGVDRNHELIEQSAARAAALDWGGMQFRVGEIESFVPDVRPNVVIALHACDTASDHVLAAFVRWQSDLALVAPCCHHHVQAQLRAPAVAPPEALLLRHGVLRERLGDVVTDAARATLLRLLGYDTDVVEFVSPEHTPKNILIRAANRGLPASPELISSYRQLAERWAVEPLLANLLAAELTARGL